MVIDGVIGLLCCVLIGLSIEGLARATVKTWKNEVNEKMTYEHAILNDSATQEKPNKDHYPKVVNGWWFVYDPLVGGFVSTEIKAQETDE